MKVNLYLTRSSNRLFLFLSLLFCVQMTTHAQSVFYQGADLSYVNEMEDCGVIYYENGLAKNPYQILKDHGANVVRIRLWNNPAWTNYSNLADVKKSIKRAKNLGLSVLLDFHYSDFWTDPGAQIIPKAWEGVIGNTSVLSDSMYNFTYATLRSLLNENIMPELVQVGNEINGEILLLKDGQGYPVDWTRKAPFINSAIRAVRDISKLSTIKPKIIYHIAGPSNADWGIGEATANGVTDFDIIGLSYYPSPKDEAYNVHLCNIGDYVRTLISKYQKQVMVVETSHSWTVANNDSTSNDLIVDPDSPESPSPRMQMNFLLGLKSAVKNAGGSGVIVWEPAWVSSNCRTYWGVGSSRENAAFFNFSNQLLQPGGIEFLDNTYVKCTFTVDMAGADVSKGVYITGDFSNTAQGWQIIPMTARGDNVYTYTTYLKPGSTGGYYILNNNAWSARETVPAACVVKYGTDRGYSVSTTDIEYKTIWQSCNSWAASVSATFRVDMTGQNTSQGVYINGGQLGTLQPMTSLGNNIYSYTATLTAGSRGNYYYSLGSTTRETVPATCALQKLTDRAYSIPNKNTTFSSSWNTCGPPQGYLPVTFKVDMTGADTLNGVFVTGDFTKLSPTDGWHILQMKRLSGMLYSLTTYMPAGASGAYYFLNGNDWRFAEKVPLECALKWGINRAYTIGSTATEFAMAWQNCAVPSGQVKTTFKVDMTGVDVSQGVYVTGSFSGSPNWTMIPMTNVGNNIFVYSTYLPTSSTGTYYFLNGNNWARRETVPTTCRATGSTDRAYSIPATAVTYAYVWGNCAAVTNYTRTYWFEAECAGYLNGGWEQFTDASASNGKYLLTYGNNNLTVPSFANECTFQFVVNKADYYTIYAKTKSADHSMDSYWVKFDNGKFINFNNIATTSTFQWGQVWDYDKNQQLYVVFLTEGTHTVTFSSRESGVQLDKVQVISSSLQPGTTEGTDATCSALPAYNQFWLEAECANDRVGGWQIGTDASASNGKYAVSPAGYDLAAPTKVNGLLYEFTVTQPGNYIIYTRNKVASTATNSFWLKVDNLAWVNTDAIPVSTGFVWTAVHPVLYDPAPYVVYLPAGKHTLTIARCDGGIQIDKILIGKSSLVAPADGGSSGTNCSASARKEAEQPPVVQPRAITLYPNPTSGQVTIKGIEAIVSARLYSENGTLRQPKIVSANQLDIQHCPAGIYLLIVNDTYSFHLIKN